MLATLVILAIVVLGNPVATAASAKPQATKTERRVRSVRHFQVFKGSELVLEIADTPGPLISISAPPPVPGARPPPPHRFLSATARVATEEHRLRQLLDASRSTEDYLAKLRAAGYRVVELAPPSAN